jgi:hypothetical protein
VEEVDFQRLRQFADREGCAEVALAQHARHRETVDSEGSMPGEFLQLACGLRVFGQAVDNKPNLVTARRQFTREVGDVAEQPADGCAHDLENAQALGHP